MSKASHSTAHVRGKAMLFPAPVSLPITEDPQVVDEHGLEVVPGNAGWDGVGEKPKLLSLARSLVLLQALRQTRTHHLTSLFPLFPPPPGKAKTKPGSKAKLGGAGPSSTAADGVAGPSTTAGPAATPSGQSGTPTTPTAPAGPGSGAADATPPDPPMPYHVVRPFAQGGLELGPIRFDDVTLYECRFDMPPPAPGAAKETQPRDTQKERERQRARERAAQAAQAKRARAAAAPPPRPPPPKTPTPITPALIVLVNAQSRHHPWLAALIAKAASSRASPAELRRLGEVVERLSLGWGVDGWRLEGEAGKGQREERVRPILPPDSLMHLLQPGAAQAAAPGVRPDGPPRGQGVAVNTPAPPAPVRPALAGPSHPPPRPQPPAPGPPDRRPSSSSSTLNVPSRLPQLPAIGRGPSADTSVRPAYGQSAPPGPPRVQAGHSLPNNAPRSETGVRLPVVPTGGVSTRPTGAVASSPGSGPSSSAGPSAMPAMPRQAHPSMPAPSQRPPQAQPVSSNCPAAPGIPPATSPAVPRAPLVVPEFSVQARSGPPPLILISFGENPNDKFVLPTEFAFLSFKPTPGKHGQVQMWPETPGKILISTFMPAAGWGKWVPPAPKEAAKIEAPAGTAEASSAAPVQAEAPTTTQAIPKGRKKAKVKVEAEAPPPPPPTDLPLPDQPFNLGGVVLPPGNVRPITISLTNLEYRNWRQMQFLLNQMEDCKDGGKRQRELLEKAKQEAQAKAEREHAEREAEERRLKEEREREEAEQMKRKEREEEEEMLSRAAKRPRRSAAATTGAPPKESTPAPVDVKAPEQPQSKKRKQIEPAPDEAAPRQRTLKERIFEVLLERVPDRMFLCHRLPEPLPPALVEAATDKFAPENYVAGSKINDDFGSPAPEAAPTKKRRAPSPTITFEMPMSFDGMEAAIAKAAPRARRPGTSSRKRGKRSTSGKPCEGCGSEDLPVWRIGPGGMKTLCNTCGEKFKAGVLGPLAKPGAVKEFNERQAREGQAGTQSPAPGGASADVEAEKPPKSDAVSTIPGAPVSAQAASHPLAQQALPRPPGPSLPPSSTVQSSASHRPPYIPPRANMHPDLQRASGGATTAAMPPAAQDPLGQDAPASRESAAAGLMGPASGPGLPTLDSAEVSASYQPEPAPPRAAEAPVDELGRP